MEEGSNPARLEAFWKARRPSLCCLFLRFLRCRQSFRRVSDRQQFALSAREFKRSIQRRKTTERVLCNEMETFIGHRGAAKLNRYEGAARDVFFFATDSFRSVFCHGETILHLATSWSVHTMVSALTELGHTGSLDTPAT